MQVEQVKSLLGADRVEATPITNETVSWTWMPILFNDWSVEVEADYDSKPQDIAEMLLEEALDVARANRATWEIRSKSMDAIFFTYVKSRRERNERNVSEP